MASGSWVLRSGDPARTVFIATGARESLAPIADRSASPKYFLVVGLAEGIEAFVKSIRFDLVVVLSCVPLGDIERLEVAVSDPAPMLLTHVTEADLADVLRRHLA